jgi:DNA gyrase subunit A
MLFSRLCSSFCLQALSKPPMADSTDLIVDPPAEDVLFINVEDEMRQSYLDYAMSVIIGRALPDARDGLKPVQRRILYAMQELGNDWNRAYKKSARIVGDVIGKYHPHGDSAVYDALVRMAQPFSLRYPLVDGQGNFGSIDGDAAAAMRYTEVRMARLTAELLRDLDKETVDFQPNYDNNEQEPTVLPAAIPNLLINGASGIAVGMATNIPPHNFREVLEALLALLANPHLEIRDLCRYIPAPDFPTAALINQTPSIRDAYESGRGQVQLRAVCDIEKDTAGNLAIVVTELPYQVNKARLLEKIADLCRDNKKEGRERKIDGIGEIRDESDKDGIRMVFELKSKDFEQAQVVLNNLYQHSELQTSFWINFTALVDGRPKLCNLKELLEVFLQHRRTVVVRRSIFELRKARERAHVLEGLAVALSAVDPIIAIIRAAATPPEAKEQLLAVVWPLPPTLTFLAPDATRPKDLPLDYGLQKQQDNSLGYRLSPAQVQAILDLRLQRLTALEQDKIYSEYQDLLTKITDLLAILASSERLTQVISEELKALQSQFADARRSRLVTWGNVINKDLIEDAPIVVTLSYHSYLKVQMMEEYQRQIRGGRGKSAVNLKEEDFVEKLLVAKRHDHLLCFTSSGKVYGLPIYELALSERQSRGKPIVNLLPLAEGERIQALIAVRAFGETRNLVFATASGIVKKTALSEYSRLRSNGLIAIHLRDGDALIGVAESDGQQDIMLFSSAAKAVRFAEADLREMGRGATGVIGMRLGEGEKVIGLAVVAAEEHDKAILTASVKGFGKRTLVSDYPRKGRGTQGVLTMKTSERNGELVSAQVVAAGDDVLLITDQATLIRTSVESIALTSRNTQGVRLIRLEENQRLVAMASIPAALLAKTPPPETSVEAAETAVDNDDNDER